MHIHICIWYFSNNYLPNYLCKYTYGNSYWSILLKYVFDYSCTFYFVL